VSSHFAEPWLSRRPYRDFHPRLLQTLRQQASFPEPAAYAELARQVPQAPGSELPRFVSENRAATDEQGGYEEHVARLRAVPTRPGHFHDFFNMTVWAHFPQVRWALNALHIARDSTVRDPRNRRTPAQNRAATFDESGMVVVSTSRAVLEELRALRFKAAFWQRRDELLESTRFWVIGHGLLESLLTPHARLSARSVLLHVPALPASSDDDAFRFELDARLARRIAGWPARPELFDPLPLLAIPGYADNDSADFYEDARNLVFDPVSRRPTSGAASFE
jgi:hypothetical protein